MTARQKIEWITNNWYGFAVVSAIFSVLFNGFGIFRMFLTAFGLAFSLGLTWMLGKLLLARSSLTRFVLVIASVLGIAGHGLMLGWSAWSFLSDWSFGLIIKGAVSLVCLMMHARSFKVLIDKDVKSYIAS
ncbi:MAG: hypothetical protein HOW73_08475 [Polyangiaceae bacterium]|nr:hypothetical protein [Polyangiaceae bacterium]